MRDYLDAARAAGLHVDVILEHEGTPRLVRRTPRATKHLGKPMLLAFRFTRRILRYWQSGCGEKRALARSAHSTTSTPMRPTPPPPPPAPCVSLLERS